METDTAPQVPAVGQVTTEQAGEDTTAPVGDLQSSEALIDEVDRLLDQVDGALARLDDGSYGTCTTCGGSIADGDLARSPTSQTCSACEAGSEG
jgi:RNA polymerase-binding transcription factor DksA